MMESVTAGNQCNNYHPPCRVPLQYSVSDLPHLNAHSNGADEWKYHGKCSKRSNKMELQFDFARIYPVVNHIHPIYTNIMFPGYSNNIDSDFAQRFLRGKNRNKQSVDINARSSITTREDDDLQQKKRDEAFPYDEKYRPPPGEDNKEKAGIDPADLTHHSTQSKRVELTIFFVFVMCFAVGALFWVRVGNKGSRYTD